MISQERGKEPLGDVTAAKKADPSVAVGLVVAAETAANWPISQHDQHRG